MVDFDPHGIEIYLQYFKHAPCHLLGMSFHDIDYFNEMSYQRIPIITADSRKIKAMLKRSNLPHCVRTELMKLNTNGFKAEMELMCEPNEPHFFTRTYVVTKIKQGLSQSLTSQPSTRISQ
jgi:DNA topoisomerase VI subunit A